MRNPQAVIGVPGKWKNREELIERLLHSDEGYILAGDILFNSKKNMGFKIYFQAYEPELKSAFIHASRGGFPEALLHEIDQHVFTIYIVATDIENGGIRDLIDAGQAILKSGGIAVKIETTGLAYTKLEWEKLAYQEELSSIYSYFVTFIRDDKSYYSCGMQTFSLPDAMLYENGSTEDVAHLLQGFNLYCLTAKSSLHSGDTFSLAKDSVVFRLERIQDIRWKEDETFYNPLGIWFLKPLGNENITLGNS